MLCDICHKNDASVHLTEIVDDQMTELHLCDECARQKSVEMEQQFGLSDLLAGLADFGKQAGVAELGKLECQQCHLKYDDFKKIGRLGCSECYESFRKYLNPLLRKIHGAAAHTGKKPRGFVAKPQTKPQPVKTVAQQEKPQKAEGALGLKQQLQEAIQVENFELAAVLRDKIREEEQKASGAVAASNPGRKSRKRKKT